LDDFLPFVIYRTQTIITCGLYISYPTLEDRFFVFKEVFSDNSVLMYGWYSRAGYDGVRTVYGLVIFRLQKIAFFVDQLMIKKLRFLLIS
jgi:hypothetical protein